MDGEVELEFVEVHPTAAELGIWTWCVRYREIRQNSGERPKARRYEIAGSSDTRGRVYLQRPNKALLFISKHIVVSNVVNSFLVLGKTATNCRSLPPT